MSKRKHSAANVIAQLKAAGKNITSTTHAAGKSIADAKNKAGDKVQALAHKVGASMGKLGEDAKFAPLLFFKPMMKLELDHLGIAYDNKMKDITQKFVDHVVKTVHHFDEDYLDGGTVASSAVSAAVSATPEGAMVQIVLDFIKQLHDKKAKGEKLTPSEEAILSQSDKALAATDIAANNAAKEENPTTDAIKEFIFSWKGGLALVAVLVLGYLAFKK